jgi:hypothetical protein
MTGEGVGLLFPLLLRAQEFDDRPDMSAELLCRRAPLALHLHRSRNLSHNAFAAVAICRFHEACASGVPGGSGSKNGAEASASKGVAAGGWARSTLRSPFLT